MLNSLTQKLNKSLQKNMQNLSEENLFSINLLKEVGLSTVVNYLKENFPFKDYLNFRALSIFKKSKEVEDKITADNLMLFDNIIKLSPHLADQYLESFFAVDKKNRSALLVNEAKLVTQLSIYVLSLKGKDYKNKIYNPFTGAIMESTFLNYYNVPKTATDLSHVVVLPERFKERKGDHAYEMNMSVYQTYLYKNNFKPLKGLKQEDLAFEFVLYHECAHASFPQMMEIDSTENEKHSDITSIIKMIKNHDLNQEEAQELCNNVIGFRVNSNSVDAYMQYSVNTKMRSHYTVDAIISLKKVLETELDEIKKLPDNKMCRYSAILIDINKKNESVIFGVEDHKTDIDLEVISKVISDHDEKIMKNGPMNSTDKWFRDNTEEIFLENVQNNKSIYEDILIQTKLSENFDENINVFYKKYSDLNPNVGNTVKDIYKDYEDKQKSDVVKISNGFDSNKFIKSINKISKKNS